jgi:NitT/TauT family transport system substrate-binding protein
LRRRTFVHGLASTTVLLAGGVSAAAEPPPEIRRIRICREASICLAPAYVAEDLLRGEGFAEVSYVDLEGGLGTGQMIAAGKADLGLDAAPIIIMNLDAGDPLTVLAGVHVGCYELFGTARVRSIRDLKGKAVGITHLRDDRHAFVASMLTQVGLDPRRDVRWVPDPAAMTLFVDGKVDAFLGFPPEPQELRARKVGRVVIDIRVDRPWSQYFCCMAMTSRDFATKHPAATKRAVRAILRANAICSQEPDSVARLLVDRGYATQLDYARQALREIPYAKWREYAAADSLRFYALRLTEAGMIKLTPQKMLSQHTDWRFLNELKRELKG